MKRALILIALLALECGLFTAISGTNLETAQEAVRYFQSYFADLLVHAAPILLLAFGMTLVLSTAGIDLSVASLVALVSCVMSGFAPGASFWWAALPAGLATGLAAGALNGILVARLDVPPIIATLGTMIFFRGLCFVIMGDLERAPFLEVPGFGWFESVPGVLVLCILVFGAGGIYFSHSIWGREVLMIGANRIAARYAGIRVERRLFSVYLLTGFLAFLAALCFTARNGSVSASSLNGVELHVIVAAVLGGTRVQGGNASILGSIFGVLFIAIMDEGLRGAAIWGAQHLPFKISHLEYLLLGLLLVFGVWLNNLLQARSGREHG